MLVTDHKLHKSMHSSFLELVKLPQQSSQEMQLAFSLVLGSVQSSLRVISELPLHIPVDSANWNPCSSEGMALAVS